MDIFSTQPGAAVAVAGPGIPVGMYLQNWGGYLGFKSIITGFDVQPSGNANFMQSLRDFIYAYVFGERMAPVNIRGISLAHICERLDERIAFPDGTSQFLPAYHGFEYVMAYYNLNRITSTGTPITIVLGLNTVLFGFLMGTQISLADPENQIAQFNLTFQGIPQVTIQDLLNG